MKRNIYILLFSLLASIATAGTTTGVDFYKAGEPSVAKQLFTRQLNGTPAEKAVACYYLGEIAFDAGQAAEALRSYQQGWSSNPDYAYNQVGEGKVLLKTDKAAAEKAFDTAIKVNKKDPVVYVAIAGAYRVNNMPAEAQSALDNARKYDPNAPEIYLYEGDRLMALNKPGEAATQYEQAIHFAPDCQEAYIKYAEVYQNVTPSLSIEMLQKVLTAHPDYLLAERTLGNIYSLQGSYPKAIDAYRKYIAGGLYSTDNLLHYASALFFNKQYADATKAIEEGKATDPDNFLLKRLNFYNAYETGNYTVGLDEAKEFFALPDAKLIWQDYLYYGRLLDKAQQYKEAIAALQKAQELSVNNPHPEINKDIAAISMNSNDNNGAIKAYTRFIEQSGAAAEASDYFMLGKYYYNAASQDSILAMEYLSKADSLFAIVKERVPASHLGVFWQARAHSLMDPETEQGLAKPFYESTIPLLEKNKEKYLKELTECYRYLGYYYYLKHDLDNSKLYWNKILSIDPGNQTAQEALKNIK